ncbi:hypothetical protein ACFLUY_01295, partial [Chloroflexota bacterium]
QIDEIVLAEGMNNIGTFKSQMAEILNKFTLDNIKYPTERESYVEVLVGAALIIVFLSQEKSRHRSAEELISRMYSIVDISVGEQDCELEIGMAPLETRKIGDNEYRLSGNVSVFLAMLACVTIWDSYAGLAAKQKDCRASFITCVKTLDFCWGTLYDSLEGIDDEAVLYDMSFQLPYSGASSSDINYLNKIVELWKLVKASLRKTADWEEMGSRLKTLNNIVKRYYGSEVSEIADYIGAEIAICEYAGKKQGLTVDDIVDAQKQMRERIIKKYFFPKGLHNQLDPKKTFSHLVQAEEAWWKGTYGTMAESMRKALEIEILATLPFLKFTSKRPPGDSRLRLRRIADAIINNENGANASIDLLSNNSKPTKTWLKKKLPGFILNVVEIRNYFEKDAHLLEQSSAESREMKGRAEDVHKRFFGIDCEGMLPFLIRFKKDIRTR